jgi:hypothetical protein
LRAQIREIRDWLVPGAGHTLAWQAAAPEFEQARDGMVSI